MTFPPLPAGPYGAVLADPPTHFRTRSPRGEGRSPSRHYRTLTHAQLARLPVAEVAARDCALFLWVTDPHLPRGLELMAAWGFEYKTVAFYWTKSNRRGGGYFMGPGYWTRANPELCLLGVRGRPRRLARDVRRLVVAPRREHSRKPDEVRDRVRRLVGGPYLELFARDRAAGWDAWGDEVDRFAPT